MIDKICERYLESYEKRSNPTVISEVLSAFLIDKYLIKDNIICVGDNQQKKLPDIFTIDKMLGFEVMRCESKLDFDHDDFQKLLDVINYNYQIYQSIRKAKSYKKFSKIIKKEDFIKLKSFNFKITFDNNRITSSTHGVFFHDKDWLKNVYFNSLNKKLEKLNKGNYSGCSNVSLVLFMVSRPVGIEQANIIKDIYSSIYDNYQNKFIRIYLFTMDDIFEITNEQVKLIYHYKNEEFNEIVDDVHKMLKIFKYATE